MFDIITIRKHKDSENDYDSEFENNPDNDYMKMSAEIDKDPPASWNRYDTNTLEGINKVIAMEYQELSSFKSISDYRKNLLHLGVALLRAWRITKNAK